MERVNVWEAGGEDRSRAVSVQVMAFASDPIMRWLYPEPHAYLLHYPAFVEAFAGGAFEHSTAYIAGDFGGAAMWLPPGVHVEPEPVEQIVKETVANPARDETFAILEEMDRYHIHEPHWYLPMIGVDPAHQGRGMGSALLRHALAKCDEAALPAYLESSNPANVPLYERHGFRVLGTIEAGSSPPVFPMFREARPGPG